MLLGQRETLVDEAPWDAVDPLIQRIVVGRIMSHARITLGLGVGAAGLVHRPAFASEYATSPPTTRRSKMRFRQASLAASRGADGARAPNAQPKRPKACMLASEMPSCFLSAQDPR